MEDLNLDASSVDCAKNIESVETDDVRILDRCSHFLGKMLDGRVYIYCGRCKKFVLVHRHST